MRKLLTKLLIFLLAVTSVFGLTGIKSVKAEETIINGFEIVGAGLRSPAGEDAYTGIRFETTVTKGAYKEILAKSNGAEIKFGTRINDADKDNETYAQYIQYVTSENVEKYYESDSDSKVVLTYGASITFNNAEFALDVLRKHRQDNTLTSLDGATEDELALIARCKSLAYAELLKATSYYQFGDDTSTRVFTKSLTRSMRMVANWYVEGNILNETQKEFIISKNYFTAVSPITNYSYLEQDGEIVNDKGEALNISSGVQVAYKAQNIPVAQGKLDLSEVNFSEKLGQNVTLYLFDNLNQVSELTVKYVTEYITTIQEMKDAVEIRDLSAEIAKEGYTKGDLYNKGYYVLGCDLDFTGYKIEHAVDSATSNVAKFASDRPFMGVFDGQGYALKNVEVTNGIGIFGMFGGLNITAVKNLAIIGYNFPKATNNNMSPLSVLGASDSLGASWDHGGTAFENLYITLGNINNDNNVNRRKTMTVGQVANGRTTFKNIVIEADITTAAYENVEASSAYKPAQPVFTRYLSAHIYTPGGAKYKEAEADSLENVIIISKDTTGNNQTFRISSSSAANEFAVAYNDKDTAKVVTTKQATNFYYPEYSYVDGEGKPTFVKPDNYEGVNNIVIRRYDDYTAFASDTKTDKTSLEKFNNNSKMWVVSNGAVYYKGIYKNIVKSFAKDKANNVVDNVIFDEFTDTYTFGFTDSKEVSGSVSIEIKGNASYLTVVGNTVKVNGTLPASETVEIIVTQEIGSYTATATYVATVSNQKVVSDLVYFDASLGKFDSPEISGTLNSAVITYGGTEYTLTIENGLVVGVTVENRTLAYNLNDAVSGYKLFVKVGENEGVEVGFEIVDDGNFDGASAILSTVEGGNYILNNVEFVTKVIKTQADLATFKVTNKTANHGYYVLGNNINVVDNPETQDVNEAIAIAHTYSYSTDGKVANFNGVFDGKGYTINNLKVNKYGMFASVGMFAIVRNFALNNVDASNAPVLALIVKSSSFVVSAETPSWITAKTYPGARAENIYIKYSSNTTMPQGIYQQTGSGFTFLIRDIVLDWQDAPTVKVENDKVYEGTTEITSGVGIYTAGGDAYAYLMSGRPTINRVYSISKYPLMYKTGTVKLNDNSGCRYVNFNSDGTKYNLVYNKTYLPTRVFGFANNTTLADITAFYNGFVNLDAGVATDISYTVQYRSTVLAFDNNTQFASGIGNSLNNFKNNAYWDTTSGYPVWKNL